MSTMHIVCDHIAYSKCSRYAHTCTLEPTPYNPAAEAPACAHYSHTVHFCCASYDYCNACLTNEIYPPLRYRLCYMYAIGDTTPYHRHS